MERMGEYYDEKPFKIHAKRKNIVKSQMLLEKQWKCYKKKPDKGTNNDSWIKQGKNNNYSPSRQRKKLC